MQYINLNVLLNNHTDAKCPLEIIGFPCNQFGLQEPGETADEILNGLQYVRPGSGYKPDFPLTEKIEINGAKEDEIFTFLKSRCPSPTGIINVLEKVKWSPIRNDDVSWNFEKFLIGHDGQPYRRYTSPVLPEELREDIQFLQAKCRKSLQFQRILDDSFSLY